MPKKERNNESKPMIATGGAVINYQDSWRIFRIIAEFVEGYQFLSELKKEVTILGSARLPPSDKYYQLAEDLGRLLAKNKFTTITGGGPGIMEAANKGAFDGNGESVGLNIQLPFEQRINPYVKKSVAFYYFFSRKVMLTSPANAFAFFPGGFGTLDEFFEVVDYMELGYMRRSPVVLVGTDFWKPLVEFVTKKSVGEVHSLPASETKNWYMADSAEEAYKYIRQTEDWPNEIPAGGTLNWHIFRIMAEMVDGFEFLTKIKKHDVTILGTKSILPGSPYYKAAQEVGKLLAQNKYTVVTGGGPGTMEAANKGAFEAGGESIGIDIRREGCERRNNYLTKSTGFTFPFVRKLIITSPSQAFVFFPGGLGTMHQLFEILTLVETKKVEPMPILLYGKEFWRPLLEFIHSLHTKFGTISQLDETLVHVINRPEEVLEHIK